MDSAAAEAAAWEADVAEAAAWEAEVMDAEVAEVAAFGAATVGEDAGLEGMALE